MDNYYLCYHLVGSEALSWPDLSGCAGQLHSTSCTVEVVGMVNISLEPQGFSFNPRGAFSANTTRSRVDFLSQNDCTIFTNNFVSNFGESQIRHWAVTPGAGEAGRMPGVGQSLNDSANYELWTFTTSGSKQNLEVMLAIFSALKLKKYSILNWLLNWILRSFQLKLSK